MASARPGSAPQPTANGAVKAPVGRAFGSGEIRCFTGLRGCAAVLVMFYHFALNMPPGNDALRVFLYNGYLWVDLFFILSGFVMAYAQSAAFAGSYRPRVHTAFLLHRIARIYPLYLLVLLESACLAFWRLEHVDFTFWRTLVLNLTMVQAWGLAPSLEGAAWSISTEWAAYLLFPLLLAGTVASGRRVAWLTGAAAALAIVCLALSHGPFGFADQSRSGPLDLYSSATVAPLIRCIAEFTLGLLAFRLARNLAAQKPAWTGSAAMATFLLLLFALSKAGQDVAVVALFVLLLVFLAPQRGVLASALSGPIPYRLGQWSYSIYLIHDKFSHPAGLLERTLAGHLPFAPALATGVTACLVVACGGVTFVYVERPLRKLLLWAVSCIPVLRSEPDPQVLLPAGAASGNANALG